MRQTPLKIILSYQNDPSFIHYYFRDNIIKSKDQILNINYNNKYYQFSVERLTIRSFSVTDYKTYSSRKTFINNHYRAVLYLEGENSVYLDNKLFKCNSNNMLLQSPGKQVSVTAKVPKSFSILEFYFDLIDENNKILTIPFVEYLKILSGIDELYNPEILTLSEFNKDLLVNKFNQILTILKTNKSHSDLSDYYEKREKIVIKEQFHLNCLILDLFNIFIECLKKNEIVKDDFNGKLGGVIKVLTENYSQNYTIQDLAEIAGLSKHYFQTQFKSIYKITPIEFLNRLKIRHAMKILENSTISCSDISSSVGINNPFYFSKIFKKYVGISPSEYRKQNQVI